MASSSFATDLLAGAPERVLAMQADAEPGDADALARLWSDGWRDGHDGLLPAGLIRYRTPQNFGEPRFRQYFPETQWETLASGPSMLHGVPMKTRSDLEQIPAFFAIVRPRGATSAQA